MKRFIFFLFIVIITACSTQGNLKINNRTAHNLYYSINDIFGTLIANQSVTLSLNTGKGFLLNSPEKTYDLYLEGETFLMYDYDTPSTHTKIDIKADRTKAVYADPSNACVKVNNLSTKSIYNFSYQKIYSDTLQKPVILTEEIPKNTVWFKQIPYSCKQDSFDIRFLYTRDFIDTIYTKTINLELDQLFLLDIH